jgi:hypothetical protein
MRVLSHNQERREGGAKLESQGREKGEEGSEWAYGFVCETLQPLLHNE